jgi:hypothetical protein
MNKLLMSLLLVMEGILLEKVKGMKIISFCASDATNIVAFGKKSHQS